jgi:HlyD family secretion protein
MRRLLPVLLLMIVGAGLVWWFQKPKPVPVTLIEVQRGKVESTVSNTRAGSVEACQRTRLSPISGGRITYLGVKKGDRVKKGQVLLKLWNDDQQAQSRLAQTQVETARKHVDEVCAVADSAEREAERMTRLRASGFVSEGSEEKTRYEAQSRRAACETSRSDVDQAQARLRVTRVERGRTILIAPFAGTVADIVGELGEYTTPSPPGVATPPAIDLIDDSCLYISAPMDEVDAPKIHTGQTARITLDALPGKVLAGHVKRVAPYVVAVEKQARTVNVEATLDKRPKPGELLVGYSADLEVILDVRDNVLRIPTSALLGGNKVLLYNPITGLLEERAIKAGLSNWEYTEVREGLQEKDRVVTSLEQEGVKAGVQAIPQTANTSRP